MFCVHRFFVAAMLLRGDFIVELVGPCIILQTEDTRLIMRMPVKPYFQAHPVGTLACKVIAQLDHATHNFLVMAVISSPSG